MNQEEQTTAPAIDPAVIEAENRRKAKAAATVIKTSPTVGDTLEKAIVRLASLPPMVRAGADPERDESVAKRRVDAGIPPRNRVDIPTSDHPWSQKRDALTERLGNGFLVAVVGKQGTGKTQFGCAMIYAAASKLMTCKYAVAMDFFIALKSAFDGGPVSESRVIQSFLSPGLLVLDEMDERSESPWENRLLFHMLNKRYSNMVDTILISRRDKASFLGSIGESLQSRLIEAGGTLEFNWSSFRNRPA